MKSLILSLLIFPLLTFGQNRFQSSLSLASKNLYYPKNILPTNDGGMLAVVNSKGGGFDTVRLILLKSDSTGNVQWQKKFNSDSSVVGTAIAEADSGFIICGYLLRPDGAHYPHGFLMRVDSAGDTLWTKTFLWAGEFKNVQQAANGDWLITGITHPHFNGLQKHFFMRTDSIGNVLFNKQFNDGYTGGDMRANFTSDEGTILFYNRPMLTKIDSSGNISWVAPSPDTTLNNIRSTYAVETPNGGYMAGGQIPDPINGSFFIVEMNNLGDTLWTKSFESPKQDQVKSILPLPDNSFWVAGEFYNSTSSHPFLMRFDSNANLVFCRQYTILDGCYEYVNTLKSSGSDIIMMGYSYDTMTSKQSAFIIKTDSLGLTTCSSEAVNVQVSGFPFTEYNVTIGESPIPPSNIVERNIYLDAGLLNVNLNNCPVGLEETKFPESQLIAYPNPTPGNFTLRTNNAEHVIITDILGQQVMTFRALPGLSEKNISLFKPGVYFITAINENQKTTLKLFVIR